MDVLLSVIIPVYNGKETIGKCLESILAQAGVELEIICVDDESTDDTLKLLEDLAKEEQRIRVLTQRNGGVASARNTGLRNAKGKYVTFIDQDDWVENDAYQTMLSLIKEYDADMAVCNYTKDYEDKIVRMLNRGTIAPFIETTEDIIQYAFYREEYRGFAAYVWNKIFRREFLEKNALCFDGKLKRGDDVLFISEVALHEPKTVYVDRYFYHYVQRSDSITHTMTSENLSRLSDILVAYEISIHTLEANKVTDDVIDYMKCFYVFHAADLYELAKKENMTEEKKELRDSMKKYLQEYKHQNADYEERLIRIEELINDRGI